MDEVISHFVKLLSNTIIVHIYSYPNFSIETLLATFVCIAHCLLIFEVNSLYRRTNAKAAAKLRLRHPIKEVESCSYHTLSQFQTQIFPRKIETTTTKQSYFVPYKRVNRKVSTSSNFGWVISHGDNLLRHSFNERVEHLLSISPSEYVRKDKERKNREAGLRSCIQSLTSLLEKALNNNTLDIEHLSKDAIKKSINVIRENFETHLSNYDLNEYAGSSLQSLIASSVQRKTLRNTLLPQLLDVDSSDSADDNKYSEEENKEKKDSDSLTNLCWKRSSDMSDLFNENSIEVIHGDQSKQQPPIALRNN